MRVDRNYRKLIRYRLNCFREVFESRREKRVSRYSTFTRKLLHKLHLGTPKSSNKCLVSYLSSDIQKTGAEQKGSKAFAKTRAQILRRCS